MRPSDVIDFSSISPFGISRFAPASSCDKAYPHSLSRPACMPKGASEIGWEKDIEIIEARDKMFPLHLTLFKSRLVVEDNEGNRIAVDKRQGRIAIERRGKVDWHREKR